METIRATFNNLAEMEAAVVMLREQGVIDINMQPEGTNGANNRGSAGVNAQDSMLSSLTNGIVDEASTVSEYIMDVVVESSRFRKVEDTIARCGGQYEGMTLS